MSSHREGSHSATASNGLSCRELEVVYRRRERLFRTSELRAVRGVTLSIDPGRAVGVVGESGSGKSTLARALVGLVHPKAGTVEIGGRDLWELDPKVRRRQIGRNVGVVFQDPRSSMNPRLSVEAVIRDPLVVHRWRDRTERRRRVHELLDAVGLSAAAADRPVRRLSGGQLQRVAIARAMALEPELIVADEPTSALDVSVQAGILNLLKELRRERGFGLLVISHDIGVVRFLADDIAVMYLGQVMEQGPADAVYERPMHPYTRALFSAVPTVHGEPTGGIVLSGAPPSASDPPSGCPFRTRCWKAESRCAQAPVPVVGDARHRAACVHPEHSRATMPIATATEP